VASAARSIAKPIGVIAFVGVLAYFVLEPLVRLQSKAFADGASGYRAAFTAPNIGRLLRYTVGLALGSLAIALVLGRSRGRPSTAAVALARGACSPIVLPAIASVVGCMFLLSPRPGYLNALRKLPGVALDQGPINVY
jgi:iron(III) transport system permease protein